MKFYVDEAGRVLGGWDDGLEPPVGAIEVLSPPYDCRQVWDFVTGTWGTVVQTRDEVERLRLVAYSDPITGSDRHFSEAVALQAMGGTQGEIDAAKAKGKGRYDEIQALYPWPDEPAEQAQ